MNKNNNVDVKNLLKDEQKSDKKYGLYTEAEKQESWDNGINPGQGYTKSYEAAAENLSEVLGLKFVKDKITQLRDESNDNNTKNKKGM